MKRYYQLELFIISILLIIGSEARSEYLFNSLSYSNSGSVNANSNNSTIVGASFATGSNSAELNDIQMELSNFTGSTLSNTISLYSSNNGQIGSSIKELGTYSSQSGIYQQSITNLSINLSANTQYWVVLCGTNGPSSGWFFSTYNSSVSQQGVVGQESYHGTTDAVTSSGNYTTNNPNGNVFLFSVTATSTPEPASIGLLATSLPFLILICYLGRKSFAIS